MVHLLGSQPDPDAVLANMRNAYASCGSYKDSGYVLSVHDGGHDRKRPFKTAFKRGDRFRFEFQSNGRLRYVLFRDNHGTKSWWDLTRSIEHFSAIGEVLTKAGGVSGRASCTVPALLLQDHMVPMPFTLLAGLRLLSDCVEGGVECYRIQGSFSIVGPEKGRNLQGDPKRRTNIEETLFVCKRRFLLVRIDDRIQSKRGGVTEMTTVYSPELNTEVPETELTFEFA